MEYEDNELIERVLKLGSCPEIKSDGWNKSEPIANGFESNQYFFKNNANSCQLHTKPHIAIAYKNIRFLEYSPMYTNDIVIGVDFGRNYSNYIILKISFKTTGEIALTTLSYYTALRNKFPMYDINNKVIRFDEHSYNKLLYSELMDQVESIIRFDINEIENLIQKQVMDNINWVIENFGLSNRVLQEHDISKKSM